MKRDENQQSLKDVLNELVGHYRKNDKYVQAEVQMAWEQVIGSVLAGKTRYIFLKRRTLAIHLDSAAFKEELSHGKSTIIENMNRELGYNAIDKVEIF